MAKDLITNKMGNPNQVFARDKTDYKVNNMNHRIGMAEAKSQRLFEFIDN